eukprot:CAMPEP_0179413418 /NCGR_PEP_ID=MMETSP0799-20121207/5085_1 /TAXON_ID=46947 /ORGANISM="Geminigera cryophila, Strain CCMP2564" /LENGTH=62 /DNA_ID=CAMNT_0021185883 /DNA_START=91 /DNA_END=279 /DNA_ORIENTATION=-
MLSTKHGKQIGPHELFNELEESYVLERHARDIEDHKISAEIASRHPLIFSGGAANFHLDHAN